MRSRIGLRVHPPLSQDSSPEQGQHWGHQTWEDPGPHGKVPALLKPSLPISGIPEFQFSGMILYTQDWEKSRMPPPPPPLGPGGLEKGFLPV